MKHKKIKDINHKWQIHAIHSKSQSSKALAVLQILYHIISWTHTTVQFCNWVQGWKERDWLHVSVPLLWHCNLWDGTQVGSGAIVSAIRIPQPRLPCQVDPSPASFNWLTKKVKQHWKMFKNWSLILKYTMYLIPTLYTYVSTSTAICIFDSY